MDERPGVPRLHGQAEGARRSGGDGIGGGRRRASRPGRRPAHPHRKALPRIPPARRRRPGPPRRSRAAHFGRAHQRARPAPDHRDAGSHPGAGGRAHGPRHLPHSRRDRARRRPRGDPARGPPARRARPRRGRLGSAHQYARARPARGRSRLPRRGAGRAARDRGASTRGRIRDLLRGFRSRPHCGGAGRRRRRRRLRPARHGPGACRSGDPLPRSHERPHPGARVRHFGTLLLKEEKAIFSSPIAYATVAVYLLLMGYTFTAVLFLNRTGELVRVFFQAPVLFLLIVPVVTMRLFAEERRTGTLELLLTSPVREIEIVLAKFVAGLTLPALMLALTAS